MSRGKYRKLIAYLTFLFSVVFGGLWEGSIGIQAQKVQRLFLRLFQPSLSTPIVPPHLFHPRSSSRVQHTKIKKEKQTKGGRCMSHITIHNILYSWPAPPPSSPRQILLIPLPSSLVSLLTPFDFSLLGSPSPYLTPF